MKNIENNISPLKRRLSRVGGCPWLCPLPEQVPRHRGVSPGGGGVQRGAAVKVPVLQGGAAADQVAHDALAAGLRRQEERRAAVRRAGAEGGAVDHQQLRHREVTGGGGGVQGRPSKGRGYKIIQTILLAFFAADVLLMLILLFLLLLLLLLLVLLVLVLLLLVLLMVLIVLLLLLRSLSLPFPVANCLIGRSFSSPGLVVRGLIRVRPLLRQEPPDPAQVPSPGQGHQRRLPQTNARGRTRRLKRVGLWDFILVFLDQTGGAAGGDDGRRADLDHAGVHSTFFPQM